MVRTRADAVGLRVTGAKAPRKNLSGPSTPTVNTNGEKNSKGGNSYFPRETPDWQKPITSFFIRPGESGESSKSKELTVTKQADEKKDFRNDDLAAGASTSKEDTTG